MIHFLLFLVSIFSFPAFADINLQGQMPYAEFNATHYSFGNIYQGQVISHSFPFKNTGSGTLILTNLHVSCGCINAKTLAENGSTVKNIFKSGESGFISVSFDSSQFAGHISRTITVGTNEKSSAPTKTLYLLGNIEREIVASPSMLYLGKIEKNDTQTFFIKLNLVKQDLKVLDVESDLPFIKTRLIVSETNPKNAQIEVKVQKADTLPIGTFQGNLFVSNTSNFYDNFKIPIFGEVVWHAQASTKFIEFGVVNENSSSDRLITFQSKNKDFAITGVKVDFNNFLTSSDIKQKDVFDIQKKQKMSVNDDDEQMNEHIIKFTLKYPENELTSNNTLLNGINVSGNFVIETNDSDYEQIKVPFFGILKKE